MKQLLNNPILVNLEIGLIEDLIKIIGSAIHTKFSHDEIDSVKKVLISKGQEAIQQAQKKAELDKEVV